MVRNDAEGSGASGAIEPLAAVGTLLPSGVTYVAGGGPSHGPSTRFEPHPPQHPGQSHDPGLHAARNGQGVGAHEADTQRCRHGATVALSHYVPRNAQTGRRSRRHPQQARRAIETAQEIERRGFGGIACPTLIGGAPAMCASLTHTTSTIPFWTAIQPIYLQNPRARRHCRPSARALGGGSDSGSGSVTSRC